MSTTPKTPNASEMEAKVAAEWDCPPEQIHQLGKVVESRGGLTGNLYEDLRLAAQAYARACSRAWCCEWVPFERLPGWEDDVFCILEDEQEWEGAMEAGGDASRLAAQIRARLKAPATN